MWSMADPNIRLGGGPI